MRRALLGLPAWKFWRRDPSTHDLFAAGAVLLRQDMQGRLNQSYYDAWLRDERAKVERKQANRECLDPRLTKMRDEICDLLHASLRIDNGHELHSEIKGASCFSSRDRLEAGSGALPDSSSATVGASGVRMTEP